MASEDDYWSRMEQKKLLISFMENGDWNRVLEHYDSDKKYREPNLVWIKPSIDLLKFVETCLIGIFGIEKVYKIFIEFFI